MIILMKIIQAEEQNWDGKGHQKYIFDIFEF